METWDTVAMNLTDPYNTSDKKMAYLRLFTNQLDTLLPYTPVFNFQLEQDTYCSNTKPSIIQAAFGSSKHLIHPLHQSGKVIIKECIFKGDSVE